MRSVWSKLMLALALTVLMGTALHAEEYKGKPAKYVFLFIGDGMAMPQRAAAQFYLKAKAEGKVEEGGKPVGIVKLMMSNFPAYGMTSTYSYNAVITDSAASGTALASGEKTLSGVVGMDPSKSKKLPTIAEMCRDMGMKVGIVSSVSIDHATPACFYAHQPTRNNYWEISMELGESGFDYFGGGQMRGETPGKRKDRASPVEHAKSKGYVIADSREKLNALKPDQKAFAFSPVVDGSCALYYDMDRTDEMISLAEFTRKGIELLDNEKGFFFMVEGGKIDWACHANDALAAIQDTLAFDAAIKEAYEFYRRHPEETLIVVTGDHECGGMTLGYAGTKYASFYEKLTSQKMSHEAFDKLVAEKAKSKASFDEVLPLIEDNFGLAELSDQEMQMLKDAWAAQVEGKDDPILYGGYPALSVTCTHIKNHHAGIAWTSYKHTAVPTPTSAVGVGCDMFNGYYDNTEIPKRLFSIMTGGERKLAMAEAAE